MSLRVACLLMPKRPTIETERLVVRPLSLDDALLIPPMANDEAIAQTSATVSCGPSTKDKEDTRDDRSDWSD